MRGVSVRLRGAFCCFIGRRRLVLRRALDREREIETVRLKFVA